MLEEAAGVDTNTDLWHCVSRSDQKHSAFPAIKTPHTFICLTSYALRARARRYTPAAPALRRSLPRASASQQTTKPTHAIPYLTPLHDWCMRDHGAPQCVAHNSKGLIYLPPPTRFPKGSVLSAARLNPVRL